MSMTVAKTFQTGTIICYILSCIKFKFIYLLTLCCHNDDCVCKQGRPWEDRREDRGVCTSHFIAKIGEPVP